MEFAVAVAAGGNVTHVRFGSKADMGA